MIANRNAQKYAIDKPCGTVGKHTRVTRTGPSFQAVPHTYAKRCQWTRGVEDSCREAWSVR